MKLTEKLKQFYRTQKLVKQENTQHFNKLFSYIGRKETTTIQWHTLFTELCTCLQLII